MSLCLHTTTSKAKQLFEKTKEKFIDHQKHGFKEEDNQIIEKKIVANTTPN